MSKNDNCKILFVDDETQALKYFHRLFEKDFDVLTASSVNEAIAIINEQADHIAVLITDQRMPQKTGTQLLKIVREEHPQIVRLLTTAYSDLDSAIEAVNSGEIFRYVTKPWDMRELQGILLRAIDFCQIQRERDQLLCEKLSVMRRTALLDQLRMLAVLIVGLEERLNHPVRALEDYINTIMPKNPRQSDDYAAGWEDHWVLSIDDSEQIVRNAREVMRVTRNENSAATTWDDLLTHARSFGAVLADNKAQLPFLSMMSAYGNLLQDLVAAGCRCANALGGTAGISFSAVPTKINESRGVKLSFTIQTSDASQINIQPHLLALNQRQTDLLLVYLLAYHFGGSVAIRADGMDVLLPECEPEPVAKEHNSDEWIERLFLTLEQ